MNKQASTNWRSHPCRCERKGAFPHSLQPNLNRSWRKECVEWSTVRAPQPEAHSDLRRKPRQVSQVNRSHTETKAREIESQHICEAKSFGRSLLKVKVENMRTPFWCHRGLKPAPEGDVDTRGCEGVLCRSS